MPCPCVLHRMLSMTWFSISAIIVITIVRLGKANPLRPFSTQSHRPADRVSSRLVNKKETSHPSRHCTFVHHKLMWFYLNYMQNSFLRWDTDAQSMGNLHITEYRDAFYRLKNLTNAKFEFNSLLGLAGQIHLLVLHPERIKKQNRITSSKQYNLPRHQTVQSTTPENCTICTRFIHKKTEDLSV